MRLGEDAQDVAFLHDQKVFAIELDLGARPFAEQDLVASTDIERRDIAIFGLGTGTHRDDFALLRLLFCGIRDDDAACGFFVFFDAAHENPVVKWSESHFALQIEVDDKEQTALALGAHGC